MAAFQGTIGASNQNQLLPIRSGHSSSPEREDGASQSKLLVFSLKNRPRMTRTSTPRTRNGCRQCKRRHTKCDETRPSCKKCVAKGLVCDGLWVVSAAKPQQSADAQPAVFVAAASSSRVPAMPGYESAAFRTSTDWDYFKAFITMSTQRGTLPVVELIELTPQVSRHHSALRDMCCGIGAISSSYQVLDGAEFFEATQYRKSLMYYHSAIKTLQSIKTTGREDMKWVILASLLFLTYELMHGDLEAAFTHFNHAHHMLEQYLARKCKETGLPFSELPLDKVESALFDILQRLITYPWSFDMSSTSKPRLDPAITFCCRGREHRYLVDDMPKEFDTVPLASRWWDITQHFIRHHIHGREDGQGKPASPPSDNWTKCLDAVLKWRSSFLPLLRRGREGKDTDSALYLQVTTLEILYMENVAFVHSCRENDTAVQPSLSPLYLDLVKQTRTLCKGIKLDGIETRALEYSLMRPLAFVVYKCRNSEVLAEVEETIKYVNNDSGAVVALRALLSTTQNREFRLRAVERSWAWYFTCVGCGSGNLDMLR
ncbi:unnamed protein product [Clonostachys rosea]|uniref:Zn(2)-C6 fungal-type domain-containing protein n=1 Tax=Bionectria ochroleuca TaxID=29856 RepID=A0ABY6UB87_BIOOC|nr:unnamed protein product [Clonostachys rosea]